MEFDPNYKLRKECEKEDLETLTKGMDQLNGHVRWIEGCRNVDVSIKSYLVCYHYKAIKWRESYIEIKPTTSKIERISFDWELNEKAMAASKKLKFLGKLNLEEIDFDKSYITVEINKQMYVILSKPE